MTQVCPKDRGIWLVLRSAVRWLWARRANFLVSALWAPLIEVSFPSAALAGTASFYYDELGRLIETVAADGTSVLYSYDAVGNITAVTHESVSSMGISGFTPASGSAGTVVTIYGSGFNTTAASNIVKFNGAAATVTAASATALSVSVPTGATSGAITVANGTATATSSASFTVASSGAPTVTSFTPTIGAPGTAVTVTGTNFQTSSATDKVEFGGIQATVTTATTVNIATSATSSGKISVTTPFGVATSTADFFDVPTGFNVADVQFTGRVAIGEAAITGNTTAAGKVGLILFDGVGGSVGNYLQLTNVTGPGGTVSVYRPDGSLLTSGPLANGLIGLPRLPTTGTYTIVVAPNGPASLSLAVKAATVVAVDGKAVAVSSAGTGYGAFFTFNGTAGQNLGLGLSGLAFYGGGYGAASLNVYKPDGTLWHSNSQCTTVNPGGGCNLVLANLPSTGPYLILVSNPGYPAIAGGTLTLSSDQTGTLVAGTAANLSLLRSGQNARLTFTGTAGQSATIRFENIVSTPANTNVGVTIFNPDGTVLSGPTNGSTSTNGTDLYVASLPVTGTYTVVATPAYGSTATLSMTLNPASELAIDGAPVKITSAATGYGTSLSFNGTAGQNLGLGLSGLAASGGGFGEVDLYVFKPDGTPWLPAQLCTTTNPGGSSGGGCNLVLANLPSTGPYLILVSNPGYPAIAGGTLTLSSDQTGTLTAGTAANLTLRSGQNARLAFTGTTASHSLVVGTPATLPSGQAVWIAVLDASGNTVASGSYSTAGGTLALGTLGAGVYTVLVIPSYGASATITLTYQ